VVQPKSGRGLASKEPAVIASLHVVTFRRHHPPVHRRPTADTGVRYWAAFSTARDPFLAIPPTTSTLRLLEPNLREWAFFAVWESGADLERFLTDSPVANAWQEESTERLSVWLKPTYVRGTWPGVAALRGQEQHGLPPAPAAVLTRLDLPLTTLPVFWMAAVPGIAPQIPSTPGLLLGVPIMQRPYQQPMTFTVWRSLDDAMSFAYRGAPHQDAVARLRRAAADIVTRFSSARFYPYRSTGTWKGENPLNDFLGHGTTAPTPGMPL